MKNFYFISAKGLRMCFNGSSYQKPDEAAIEEGQRLSKTFKNLRVFKVSGSALKLIFKAKTGKEIRRETCSRIQWVPCGR